MTLLLIVLLPFIGVGLPLFADRFGRLATTLATALPVLAALGLLLTTVPTVFAGETLIEFREWIPALGMHFSLRIDGLAFLFASLILGIGALIVFYAHYYLSSDDPIGRFFAYLLLFMGAMLGVVLSENVLLLAFFWEITSLSSFLLIGYWSSKSQARQGARMALAITGLGGLGLFAGLLIVGHIVGSYELTQILASGELIVAHDLYLPALLLILLGAFTKSAQFPFHFWLPNAMAAPTPVSAYLHSATMVKAGVFLLARLHPALSGSTAWILIVSSVGLFTMGFAAYIAIFRHDLKGLLAYSTISHLGLITALFGFGTKAAVVVGVFHIFNHAAFKASLFMIAGIIDHETGTRDIRILHKLRTVMPLTMVLALFGAAAMAGMPLLNGFLSKEMFLDETLNFAGSFGGFAAALIVLVAAAGTLFGIVYSLRFFHEVFFKPGTGEQPLNGHDPPYGMLLAPAILVALCLAVGLLPTPIAGPIVAIAAGSIVGELPSYRLAIWHGINLPLIISIAAIVVGTLFYLRVDRIITYVENLGIELTGKRLFSGFSTRLFDLARRYTALTENHSLQRYMGLLITMSIIAGMLPFFLHGFIPGTEPPSPINPISIVLWAILVISSIALVLLHRRRLVAVILMGVTGLMVSLLFIYMAAPDLALTQLSVEVVTVILLLLALFVLPEETILDPMDLRKVRDLIVCLAAGLASGILAWLVMTRPQDTISTFHLEQATYPVGGGTNVVNVMLVDFRAFDTFGEITVLVIAAFGIFSMLRTVDHDFIDGVNTVLNDRYPVMLTSVARLLLPLIAMMALFLFMRGHYSPGGGFIAGLAATVALILQYLASGVTWARERFHLNFRVVALLGLFIALIAGLVPILADQPFLTMYVQLDLLFFGHTDVIMTLLFDLGVFLTVLGATMTILSQLTHMRKEDNLLPPDIAQWSNPWKP